MAVVLGVTGGIATGKSTVISMLSELGVQTLDADRIAREVLIPGSPGYQETVEAFGPDILSPNGQIDRQNLGALVFSDENALEKLNEITHPRIIKILEDRINKFRKDHQNDDAVLAAEIPLLVECKLFSLVDKVIVVVSEQAAQIRRLTMRSSLSKEEAARRVAAQMPVAQKEKHGDWIIRTDGTLEDTRRQVELIWQQVVAKAP